MNDGLYIFDLDGTLVDSYPQIYEAFVASLKRVKATLPSSGELCEHLSAGGSMSDILRSLFPHWCTDQRLRFRQCFGEIYPTLLSETQIFPGADDVLSTLAGRCMIVSNKPQAWGEVILKDQGWGDTPLICPGPTMQRKPAPDMLNRAKDELRKGRESQRVVAIGDTMVDLEAACRADIPFLGVAWSSVFKTRQAIEDWHTFLTCIRHGGVGGLDVYLGS